MKKTTKRILALVMCICLCHTLISNTFAVNESNSKGVTFALVLDKEIIPMSSEDQTVTATIQMSQATNVIDMEYYLVCDSSFAVAEPTAPAGITSWNASTKHMTWMNVSDVNTDTLGSVTITIPANTPAGTYPISVNDILLSDDASGYWEKTASATATLTISDDPALTADYYATVSSTTSVVVAGDAISVALNVSGNGKYTEFNAAEIQLSYSGNIVFDKDSSSLSGAEVSVSNGTITLVDKGEAEELGNGVYMLAFTATEAGSATVTLVSAAFGTAEESETEDLVEATCDTTPVTITITPAVHSVTLPAIFSGAETVANGSSYTFSKETATGAYYNYGTVTATMGGTSVPVTDNGDGTWTIANVTGELVISGSRTEKQYDVTINGETAANDGAQATYNTNYSFTLPADVAAGLENGYTYALTSVTIDGKAYNSYSVDGKTYTIPGADITGNVEITITETVLEPNKFTVSVSGSGAGAVTGTFPATVSKGGSFALTLSPETGYTYAVSAEGYDVAVSGNTYTISNITGNVTFVVTRSVIIDNVTVSEYVTLNGTSMWLVKNTTEKLEGKLYTYQGQNMFWSEEQGAYCTLVISVDKPAPAADDFAIITGTAQELSESYDVNKTGTVDANDAQLVYNIYMVHYDSFTENVTMEKFLMADINGDGKVDVNDAAAIVSSLLA